MTSEELQKRLESSLRRLVNVNVSPEYALTWKEQDMPSGLPICALRASARRIQDNGYTGWPTPAAMNSREHQSLDRYLARMARHPREMTTITNLTMLVKLIGWAKPTTRDHKDGTAQSCQNVPENSLLGRQVHGLKCVIHGQAKDASGGLVLNPFFSLHLMGYPLSWGIAGICAFLKSETRL